MLVQHRKGRSTCGVQSSQAHVSLRMRSLGSPGSGSVLNGPWGSGSHRPAVRSRRPPLAAFSLGAPCETAWQRWKSGAQADKRGGVWAWASFIFPNGVVRGEGHDACSCVTDNDALIALFWAKPPERPGW